MSPTETVVRRVAELRRKRGLTGAKLAERMTEVGVKWDRSIVANLENRRRSYVTVDELLALAYVLEVFPAHLLVPIEDEALYRLVPGREDRAGDVREWVRARLPLTGMDTRVMFTDVPEKDAERFAALLREHETGRSADHGTGT
ncbi:MAG: helix-turn-helix domain protein [Streptosporangiaceae bacterium]|nr:helix-turn-helix domain protein [Streptosporangiaceae bacterium]